MHNSFNKLVIQSNILRKGMEMLKHQDIVQNDEERKSFEEEDELNNLDEGMKLMTGPRVSI